MCNRYGERRFIYYCIGAEPPIQPIQDDSTDSAISVTQVNYRKTGVRLLSLSLSLFVWAHPIFLHVIASDICWCFYEVFVYVDC